MNEQHHRSSRRQHRDSSDIFRESSLRAIHRRKLYARVLFAVVSVIAVIMLVLVFAAYFLDK